MFIYLYLKHEPSGDGFVHYVTVRGPLRDSLSRGLHNLRNAVKKFGRADVLADADAGNGVTVEVHCDREAFDELIVPTMARFSKGAIVFGPDDTLSTNRDDPLRGMTLRIVPEPVEARPHPADRRLPFRPAPLPQSATA